MRSAVPLCFVLLTFLFVQYVFPRRIIVLDPAGHAGNPGRTLLEGFERAQTLRFARQLKEAIERRYRGTLVILSRSTGETLSFLQIPSFANRLGAHLCVRLSMCREASEKPKIFLYHLLFDSLRDLACREQSDLALTPLYQAHYKNIHKTRLYGKKMYDYLSQDERKRYFDCYPLRGLPLVNLIGFTAPTLLIEVGICRDDKWKELVSPIAESLYFVKEKL